VTPDSLTFDLSDSCLAFILADLSLESKSIEFFKFSIELWTSSNDLETLAMLISLYIL
jgi:hypothetical protein